MKKLFVDELKAGETIEEIFILAEKHLYQKRNGDNYLNITLADKSGRIKGVVWDNVDHINSTVNAGDYVMAKGSISEYKGLPQFVIKVLSKCPIDAIDPFEFLPASTRNVDQMFNRLKKLTDSVTDEDLQRLLAAFWNDSVFVEHFKAAPAAKKMHHAYLGGLLEHTLSMALLADRIASHYTGINRDLLICGAVFHDIGKIREFEYQANIDYSDEGRLISHITIGVQIIEEKLLELADFPSAKAMLLKHLVISHHGARELGSPEPPKTIEAVLLNHIDEMDSKVNAIREYIAADQSSDQWTPYHRLLERHFFKG